MMIGMCAIRDTNISLHTPAIVNARASINAGATHVISARRYVSLRLRSSRACLASICSGVSPFSTNRRVCRQTRLEDCTTCAVGVCHASACSVCTLVTCVGGDEAMR